MLRATAAALAAVAVAGGAPALAAAQGAPAPGLRGTFDPSASGRTLAFARAGADGVTSVVVRRPGRPAALFPDAWSPAVDGDRLAVVDAAGVRVLRWTTGEELARLPGPLSKPALDWPWIAYVRTGADGGQRLEVHNLATGRRRPVARMPRSGDLGRPALRGALVAWHTASGRRSVLRVGPVAGRGSRVVATSVTGLQVNPSLGSGRILWVEHTGSRSVLRLRRVGGGPVRALASVRGPSRILWTTALGGRRAYATSWNAAARSGRLVSRAWR